jgi:hypothetical protein
VGSAAVFLLLAVVSTCLILNARREKKARRRWEEAMSMHLDAQDGRIADLGRVIAPLAPASERPTAAHGSARAPGFVALAPAPARPGPALAAPALQVVPRLRVDIRPSAFPSDRLVVYGTAEQGESIVVDARDVFEREGTMPVDVLDATSRDGEAMVLVQLPPERVPRGPRVWILRSLLVDVGAARSRSALSEVETEGDRAGSEFGRHGALQASPDAGDEATLRGQVESAAERALVEHVAALLDETRTQLDTRPDEDDETTHHYDREHPLLVSFGAGHDVPPSMGPLSDGPKVPQPAPSVPAFSTVAALSRARAEPDARKTLKLVPGSPASARVVQEALAKLAAPQRARIEKMAVERGISRETMMAQLLERGEPAAPAQPEGGA